MLYSNIININKFLIYILVLIIISNIAKADFFENITGIIEDNDERLSYGISVNDITNDGNYELVVTGFGTDNLALSYRDGVLKNIIKDESFSDSNRRTIGVVACDIDQDGYEEIYFLNTDTYSGNKLYSDRLLDFENSELNDLFSLEKNKEDLNYTAGRSVACVDRQGNGKYGIYVSNYGGPTRFYELENDTIIDQAPNLQINRVTGGRAVVVGNIISEKSDIFAANERGSNFLYVNNNGKFIEVAKNYGIDDELQNGRGTTLSDIFYDGELDIINGNWKGYHRAYVKNNDKFIDIANKDFRAPTKVRTVISADFDNDGYDEIFFNNIGEPNKLFRINDNGEFLELQLNEALEPNGLGTGAAVADINNDGVLELLISHGETAEQPLSLFRANVQKNHKWIRILPKNIFGAPARGGTVTLYTNQRTHAKTIDAGSGYLCQMEPIAHYGIRNEEIIEKIVVTWTDGTSSEIGEFDLNQTIEVRQDTAP